MTIGKVLNMVTFRNIFALFVFLAILAYVSCYVTGKDFFGKPCSGNVYVVGKSVSIPRNPISKATFATSQALRSQYLHGKGPAVVAGDRRRLVTPKTIAMNKSRRRLLPATNKKI